MRILFITWDGPQVNYLETLFLPIFVRLKAHGFYFDILQFRWGDRLHQEAIGRACAAAGIGYRAVTVWRRAGSAGPLASAVLGGLQVRRAARHFGSDVLMPRSVLPSLAVLAGRASQLRPVLLDADGLEIDERAEFSGMRSTGFAYRLLRDVESQMVRLARAVLVRTAATRDILVARAGPSVTLDRFHVVTNGRDAELFHPGDGERRRAVRSELGIANDAPLVLYIGSVGARYRTRAIGEFALELRKLRPDTRLLVLSGSPETARTELIEALPELAAFTTITRANPTDVSRIASAADVGTALIRPSFSTQGIAPVKTAEYLLCGVPVLGTAEVGDNQTALAQGVFFDEQRGLDEGARWVAETVLPEREAFRERARRVGVDRFSLDRSVCDYRIALEAMKASLAEAAG